jgi:threonine synthase
MDILISSNLERFLFDMNGRDSARINSWYDSLAFDGSFTIDSDTRKAIDEVFLSGWIGEDKVLDTIGRVYRERGYVLDTHTAVGVALSDTFTDLGCKTIIASTASPYKFSCDVFGALEGATLTDEFACIERLAGCSGVPVHRALKRLRERPVLHDRCIETGQMRKTVLDIIASLH